MTVNCDKSNIVHFRASSISKTEHVFEFNSEKLEIVHSYKYLGVVLNEFLDYNEIAKTVAMSASRALGLVISKSKAFGGFQYSTFTKLYDSMVWPIINYSAPIWGDRSYSCINAVHHRAMRYYLGVGRYTPNVAVSGEMGWKPPIVRQWVSVFRQYFRVMNMDDNRINKSVYMWSKASNVKNGFYRLKKLLKDINSNHILEANIGNAKPTISMLESKLMEIETNKWKLLLERENAIRGNGGNKLRTYRKFKSQFCTEKYLTSKLPFMYRSAFTKFRCGVAPLRIETGRYENIDVMNRKCFNCPDTIEDEKHVLLYCPLYNDIRKELVSALDDVLRNRDIISDDDKMVTIFSSENLVYLSAKACHHILFERKRKLYCKS